MKYVLLFLDFDSHPSNAGLTPGSNFQGASVSKTLNLGRLDDNQIEEWLFAIENTRHTVTLPITLAMEFANLSRGKLDVLDEPSILDFYKLLYSRVVKFTSYIEEFSQLSTNDRKFLLSHNLEALSIVRLAVCFDESRPANLAQLKEFGRPDVPIGQDKINIEQIFRAPWAADESHVDLYCKTVKGLAQLPFFDAKSSLLLQLLALFDTTGISATGRLEDLPRIERQQQFFVQMLLSYLRTKVASSKSNLILHKYLLFFPTLRTLCEKIARQKV